MLTGILTKPANINKGQDNIMTLDRDALLADVIANRDSYFHQLGRWSQVLITYKSSQGEQLNHLEFDPTTGAFPTANFNPSTRARNTWLVQTVMVRDLDEGEIIYYRDEVDTAHFDITLDQTAPTLNPVTIASNNANTSIANIGDTITLSFTGSEALTNVSATILGQSANISGSGTNWTASYTLVGGEPAGIAPFTIDFEDVNNNQGVQVISTTDASSVTVQYVVPTLDIVTIYSDNANPAIAITGDTVSLDFTASDSIANISVSILGNNLTASSLGGNQYRVQYIVQAGDSNGLVNFSIDYEDLYNNTAPTVTTTTDTSSVTISNDKPEFNSVSITSNNSRNTSYADVGDIVNLVVRADESDIVFNSVSILGNAVTMLYQGPVGAEHQYRAQYTVQNGDSEGIVNFSIDFQNNLGVDGDQVTSTTNGSSVTILNQILFNFLGIESDNLDITYAEPGDIVTVTMTTPSTVTNVEFRLFNSIKSATNTSGNNWECDFNYSELERANEPGRLYESILVNYDQYIPSFGGLSDADNTTNGSSVYVNTLPSLDSHTFSSNNPNNGNLAKEGDIITLDLVCSENVLTPAVTILGNTANVTGSGSNYTATYTVQSSDPTGFVTASLELVDSFGASSGIINLTSSIEITPLIPIVLGLKYNKLRSRNSSLTNTVIFASREDSSAGSGESTFITQVGVDNSVITNYDCILPIKDFTPNSDTSTVSGVYSGSALFFRDAASSLGETIPFEADIILTDDNSVGGNSNFLIANLLGSQSSYSINGVSWNAPVNLPILPFKGAYGNGAWVLLQTNGEIARSTDGTNWTLITNITPNLNSVAFNIRYVNNLFIVLGEDEIFTSTDAITWTKRLLPSSNITWQDVAYGDGVYIIVQSDNNSTNDVLTSTDLINWQVDPDVSGRFYSIEYVKGTSSFVLSSTSALRTRGIYAWEY
jgi:hypothetical protein